MECVNERDPAYPQWARTEVAPRSKSESIVLARLCNRKNRNLFRGKRVDGGRWTGFHGLFNGRQDHIIAPTPFQFFYDCEKLFQIYRFGNEAIDMEDFALSAVFLVLGCREYHDG